MDGFDHHCDWLDNCIGRANYRLFNALILLVELFTLELIASEVFAFEKWGDYEDHLNFSIIAFSLLINFGIACFTLVLILFHVYLRSRGLTTYEFIKNRHRKGARRRCKVGEEAAKELETERRHDYWVKY